MWPSGQVFDPLSVGLLCHLHGWPRPPHWTGVLETGVPAPLLWEKAACESPKEEGALEEVLALPPGAFLLVGRPLAAVWVATIKVPCWC